MKPEVYLSILIRQEYHFFRLFPVSSALLKLFFKIIGCSGTVVQTRSLITLQLYAERILYVQRCDLSCRS